jgi:large subunit ribosomal protein L4
MSNAIKLDKNFKSAGEVTIPEAYSEINPHNLYLYVKSYQASLRANTARAKTRAEVRGGGKKPWAQKGRGGARAGSSRSPIWVGGGKAFGPTNRNYNLKVNKKQKRLAFELALAQKAENNALYVVDKIEVPSGKTKDVVAMLKTLEVRDALVITQNFDEKTYLAYRNVSNCYLVEPHEVNAYLLATYRSVIVEESVLATILSKNEG